MWKQFTDPYTDILKGQLIEDQYERYYFCSPTTGPMFNTYARMLAGLPDYRLGVPGPNIVYDAAGNNADKPTITSITGGAAPVTTRAYIYTWVNEFGEESAPSLAGDRLWQCQCDLDHRQHQGPAGADGDAGCSPTGRRSISTAR